jgi:hypothetical protein
MPPSEFGACSTALAELGVQALPKAGFGPLIATGQAPHLGLVGSQRHAEHVGYDFAAHPLRVEFPRELEEHLVGDVRQGRSQSSLHAWRLAFAHPGSGERATFEAPVPADLVELWKRASGTEWPIGTAPDRPYEVGVDQTGGGKQE